VQRFGRWLIGDELFTTGSSLAFYALLSLPPMVLIGLWFVGVFVDDGSLQSLGQDVEGQAPDALPIGDVVRSLVDVATQVGWLSILAAVWPSTRAARQPARCEAPRRQAQGRPLPSHGTVDRRGRGTCRSAGSADVRRSSGGEARTDASGGFLPAAA
jgi:hypothetical protein